MIAYDTNALLKLGKDIYNGEKFVISSVTLQELENIKTSFNKSDDVKFQARRAVRLLDEHPDDYDVIIYTDEVRELLCECKIEETPDSKICACIKEASYYYDGDIVFISDDISCRTIAREIFGLTVHSVKTDTEDYYKGYKEVVLNNSELAYLYEHLSENKYDLLVNEYLIVKDSDGETVDKFKWDGTYHKTVVNKTIKTNMFGSLKPLDDIQACAIDSISSNEITVLYGRAGSGKTTLPLSYIMQQIEKGKIDKLYIIYSYDILKNSRELGFEAGSHYQKILTYGAIGNILSSKFGDISQVEYMIERGTIDIIPTANIRGVEFTENSIVLVTECQNLDVYTLKTIIQRCKAGCKQIYEGDVIEQKDKNIQTVGMNRLIEVFKDNEFFGCIKLKNNYRSPIGELADKL